MQHQTVLTWRNLTAEVKGKKILHENSGYCKSGEMLAIMGPSGAGKTTLLSMLSNKMDGSMKHSGEMLANQRAFDSCTFYNFGTYIYQSDILHEMLTPREILSFTASLKIKNSVLAQARVDYLLQQFSLQKCSHLRIGAANLQKGISGGEKKRVCIAIQMITNPSVIILDQPTSGLDSHKAVKVLKVLKNLAAEKHTIIFTIHQPSFLLYSMLDRLILLDKGFTIYQGSSQRITTYLSENLKMQIPEKRTISDFFMFEISEYKAQKEKYQSKMNAANYQLFIEPVIQEQLMKIEKENENVGYQKLQCKISFWVVLMILLRREWTMFWRNSMKYGMLLNAFLGMITVGLVFLDSIPSKQRIDELSQKIPGFLGLKMLRDTFIGVQGVCFIYDVGIVFTSTSAVSLSFPLEKHILYKETVSKKYTLLPYFLAKIILELPINTIGIIIFASGSYWLNGFDSSLSKWIYFTLSLIVLGIVGNSLGLMIGTLFQDVKRVTAMTPLLVIPFMMLSGFYNRLDSIPKWISWLQYASPYRYGLHALVINQYGDAVFKTADGIQYNYKSDLEMSYTYQQNLYILLAIAALLYVLAFIFLINLTKRIST